MQIRLTDLAVQKLGPGTYSDIKTPAFGIRVGKNRRTWFYVHTTTRKRIGIGHYPALSLSEARKRALVAIGSPTDERPSISFSAAIEAFLALPRWRPSTKRVVTSSLKHFSFKGQLAGITHEQVARALDAIEGDSARWHARKDITTFFNWCVPRYLSASPAAGLKAPTLTSRDRILTADELKAIWRACDGTFGAIVKLLLLTGARKMEIGRLRSEYVNGNTITLPASVTKNGREHTFPIGPMSKAILPDRKGYLFLATGSDKEPYNGFTYHLKQLQKASKTKDWTLHDLRRTFVSLHAEIGTPIHIAEKLVNHVSGTFGGVRGIYDRYTYLDEMRAACLAYEKHIGRIIA